MNQEPQPKIPWQKDCEPTSIALLQADYDRVRREAREARNAHDAWVAGETIVHDRYSALQHAYDQRHGKPGGNYNG